MKTNIGPQHVLYKKDFTSYSVLHQKVVTTKLDAPYSLLSLRGIDHTAFAGGSETEKTYSSTQPRVASDRDVPLIFDLAEVRERRKSNAHQNSRKRVNDSQPLAVHDEIQRSDEWSFKAHENDSMKLKASGGGPRKQRTVKEGKVRISKSLQQLRDIRIRDNAQHVSKSDLNSNLKFIPERLDKGTDMALNKSGAMSKIISSYNGNIRKFLVRDKPQIPSVSNPSTGTVSSEQKQDIPTPSDDGCKSRRNRLRKVHHFMSGPGNLPTKSQGTSLIQTYVYSHTLFHTLFYLSLFRLIRRAIYASRSRPLLQYSSKEATLT